MSLLLLSLAWFAGVIAAALGFAAAWPLVLLGGAGVSFGLLCAGERQRALLAALALLLCLGGLYRYDAAQPPTHPGGIALLNDGPAVTLRGLISQEPEQRATSQRFAFKVDAVQDENGAWQPSSGTVLVTAKLFPRFAYGNRLELHAELETPPSFDGFDYREYLARRGIVSVTAFAAIKRTGSGGGSAVVRLIEAVRRPFDTALARSLPEPEAALARGILLGQRAAIPADLTDDFNRAGISHIIAISGFNITLVAGYAVGGLSWLLGRRRATWAAIGLVLVYAVLVGLSPSVLRAVVMGVVMLGASLAGRPGSALTAVCFAGALLSAAQPLIVDDVAFQLSFGATLGLIVLARPLQRLLEGAFSGWLAPLAAQASVTLAASLAVLPVMASSFGRVSLVALPANLLAVPSFPLILAASALTAGVGAVSTSLGRLIGDVAYLPLAFLVLVGRTAAGLPFASLSIGRLGTYESLLLGSSILLLAVGLQRWRPATEAEDTPLSLRLRPGLVAALVVVLLAGFVWWQALSGGDQRLVVSVLDVGQGDAILIQTPAGQHILVDGGPSGDRLQQALGSELPASMRRFDLVVLTHGQDDHVTGLVSVLERYEVEEALAGPLPGATAAFRAWQDELVRRDVPVHAAVAGEWADLGAGVRLEVLNPQPVPLHGTDDDLNNNCVVLRLVYGKVSFLLTCDLEAAGEDALLAGGGDLRSTVLKVGHHGSDGSTQPGFLAAVDPDFAVISVGADNSYGHPSPTTLLRLAGIPMLRTDQNGSVSFETDGRGLWLQYGRGQPRTINPGASN